MSASLPEFLRVQLANCPQTGGGVHNWLFCTARQLHAHLPTTEIVSLLESCIAQCGRRVPRAEIVAAVENSKGCAWAPGPKGQPPTAKPEWPEVNRRRRIEIIRDGGGLADLWEASPIRFEDNDRHTEAIVDQLFPGNPLLCCCGKAKHEFNTRPREEWRGHLARLQFIVPSPMAAITGLTKEGKVSEHSLEAVGPRRFLVCEFDGGDGEKGRWPDQHAALLLHLGSYAPLVLAVHSGGKSLHGWFFVAGEPEAQVLKFFRYARSMGADQATWTPSQFVRMPDGTRDNCKRQTVFYFNPAARRFGP